MGMFIREKQVCSILISWPCLGYYWLSGPYRWSLSRTMIIAPSGPYRWSLSRTMITAPSDLYRSLFRTVSTAPSDPYSFLYLLLRFMQTWDIKKNDLNMTYEMYMNVDKK